METSSCGTSAKFIEDITTTERAGIGILRGSGCWRMDQCNTDPSDPAWTVCQSRWWMGSRTSGQAHKPSRCCPYRYSSSYSACCKRGSTKSNTVKCPGICASWKARRWLTRAVRPVYPKPRKRGMGSEGKDTGESW